MDIKFPKEENPFPRTMAVAVFAVIVAFLIGMFLGNALGALFGTDESVINTTTYTDYMSAAKSVFSDANQLDSYMDTAQDFRNMNGLRLYGSRDGDKMLAWYNGAYQDISQLFANDEEIQRSLIQLMNTEDALYGVETSGGSAITNLRLWNIAVEDNVVYYYLYYDEAGYVGIAYDDTETVLADQKDSTVALTKNKAGEHGMWYITYYLED